MKEKRQGKNLKGFILAGILSFMVLGLLSVRVYGETIYVNGHSATSRFSEDAVIILKDNSSIEVDQSRTIRCIIGGKYDLYITQRAGTDARLTIGQQAFPSGQPDLTDWVWKEEDTLITCGTFTTNANLYLNKPTFGGIHSSGKITINKGADITMYTADGLISGGNIDINADVYAGTFGLNAISAEGDIKVQGGKVSAYANSLLGTGIIAGGNITLSGGKISAAGADGIRSRNGGVNIGTEVSAEATNGTGLSAWDEVIINGKLESKGSGNAVSVGKKLTVTSLGAITNATGGRNGIAASGEIVIEGTVYAKGEDDFGLYTSKKITIKGGTTEAEGGAAAVSAKDLEIAPSRMILSPPGAKMITSSSDLYGVRIRDMENKDAKAVKIGPGKVIPGSVSVTPRMGTLYCGTTLTAEVSGIDAWAVNYQWQHSEPGTGADGWRDIKNATKKSLETRERDDTGWYRCYVYADGFAGALLSEDVLLYACYPQVSKQPADAATETGTPVTFTVEASNAASYKWMLYSASKNSEGALAYDWVNSSLSKNTEYTSIKGQGTKSITLTPKSTYMNGLYIGCEITSPQGKKYQTRMAAIKVTRPPALAKGKTFVGPDGATYKVTGSKPLTVTYVKCPEEKKKTAGITGTVTYKTYHYRITSIGAGAFKNNSVLEEVKMGINVTKIGKKAFYGCSKLKKISIGKNVEAIGDYAFWKCKSLKSVTLPEQVYKIGKYAFYKCSSLEKLTVASLKLTISKTGRNAFKGTPLKLHVFVPEKELKYYKKLFKQKGVKPGAKITAPKG